MADNKKSTNYFDKICHCGLIDCITLIENILESKNIKLSINIELEGVYLDNANLEQKDFYQKLNSRLKDLETKGRLKPEFWKNQWEYESEFQIGNIIEVIANYQKFCKNINQIFLPQIAKIEPVIYEWCKSEDKIIHVPNAIQINISLWKKGLNMLADKNFAFYLQNLLIKNSINNLLFFTPNQESLDRFFLKEKYSLQNELMSPYDISGGTKGSIACYLKKNKKDLPNDLNINFENLNYKIAYQQKNWQRNSRIEFRLASASLEYNIKLHILFIMLIMLESVLLYQEDKQYRQLKTKYKIPRKFYHIHDDNVILRYKNDSFFSKKIELFLKKNKSMQFIKLEEKLKLLEAEMGNIIQCIRN